MTTKQAWQAFRRQYPQQGTKCRFPFPAWNELTKEQRANIDVAVKICPPRANPVIAIRRLVLPTKKVSDLETY